MKRRARILSIFLLFVILITMMPATASAASKKPGKSKITGITVAQNNVTVKCKKAKNAKSYRLYNVTYAYKWKYLKKIKASQKKKYSDTAKYQLKKSGKKYKVYKKKAVAKYTQLAASKKKTITFTGSWGTAYTLAVRAYNGKKAGAYSSTKQVAIGKAPAPAPTPTPVSDPAPYDCHTYVFFGSDSRATDDSWKSPNGGRITTDETGTEGVPRSDVIMLINVNETKKSIDFISIYRDTALNKAADGYNFQKANKAYADFGPEEACRVLERNLDIDIKGYAASNFKGVADVIDDLNDALGEEGVEVDGLTVETDDYNAKQGRGDDVTDVANNYIDEMNGKYGLTGTEKEVPHIVKGKDRQLLSGLQAVAYARVRYTDGSDMVRTMRQKTVLIQMIKKYRELSKLDSDKAKHIIINNTKAIETNLGLTELANLIEAVHEYTIDENLTNSPGFPYDIKAIKYRTNEERFPIVDLLVPVDLQSNVKRLHHEIYGDNSYVPSDTVVDYSEKLEKIPEEKEEVN